MRSIISAAVLALATTAANAEDVTSANSAVPGCKALVDAGDHAELMKQGFCMGMVIGISSMQALEMARQQGKSVILYCFDVLLALPPNKPSK